MFSNDIVELDKLLKNTKSLFTNKRTKKKKIDSIVKASFLFQNLQNFQNPSKQSFVKINPSFFKQLTGNEIDAVYNDFKNTFKQTNRSKQSKIQGFHKLFIKNSKLLKLYALLGNSEAENVQNPNEILYNRVGWNYDQDNQGDDDNILLEPLVDEPLIRPEPSGDLPIIRPEPLENPPPPQAQPPPLERPGETRRRKKRGKEELDEESDDDDELIDYDELEENDELIDWDDYPDENNELDENDESILDYDDFFDDDELRDLNDFQYDDVQSLTPTVILPFHQGQPSSSSSSEKSLPKPQRDILTASSAFKKRQIRRQKQKTKKKKTR